MKEPRFLVLAIASFAIGALVMHIIETFLK